MGWNVQLPAAEWFTPTTPGLFDLIEEAKKVKLKAIDTETTGLMLMKDIPLYWSLAWIGDKPRRICLRADTLPFFKDVFADPKAEWVFANAKFDMHMLANVGVHFAGKVFDTQVMHALLYEEQPHGLKAMAQQILGWRWNDFFDTFRQENVTDLRDEAGPMGFLGKVAYKRKETIGEMLQRIEVQDLESLVQYASNDAYGTLMVYMKLLEELNNSPVWSLYPNQFSTLADIFFKVEAPFTRVLWTCERNGVMVNSSYLRQIEGPMEEELGRLAKEMNRLAGRIINPNSPSQLANYFFKEVGLKPVSFTKGGKTGVKTPSVDSTFLEHYADSDPMAGTLLKHRQISKLLGTYVQGLQEWLTPQSRIHTRFNQDVARTGRLSSTDPALQTIPRPDNDQFKLRGAFVAPEGKELIVGDYEALEMRLLAAAAMDPTMTQVFLDGKDIHMGNAEMVFGVPYSSMKAAKKIDKEVKEGHLPDEAYSQVLEGGFTVQQCLDFRNDIKAIGFGLNYGMKAQKLSKRLNCTVEEAQKKIKMYMDTYPAVAKFYEDATMSARNTGYAFTVLGRRRFLPEIMSSKAGEAWRAERQATNVVIQGSAADVAKMAMLNCYDAGLDKRYGALMLLQIHDELVFECPKETVTEALAEIKEWMEHPLQTDLTVPLSVSIGKGASWMTAK